MKKYYSQEIIDILRSIKSLEIDDIGRLNVTFEGDKPEWGPTVTDAFRSHTFTHELLKLIEKHMSNKR